MNFNNEDKPLTDDNKNFIEENNSSVDIPYWTRELKKQDQKLQELRNDKEFWLSRYQKEKENGSCTINELKFKIHEKLVELNYSKTEIKKMEDILKQEEVSVERLQHLDEIGAKLKAEEEDLLITVVFMKEKLKNYDDVMCEKQKLLSQINEKEELIKLREEEFANKLNCDKLESEEKYNRLRISISKAVSNFISEIQENSQKRLQYVANEKSHEIAAKREKLCTISGTGLKLLKKHIELREREKWMQIESDINKDITQMLYQELQTSKVDLLSYLDGLVMQQKASILELENEQASATVDNIPPSEDLVLPCNLNGYIERSEGQERVSAHEKAIVAEETQLKIFNDEELPIYNSGYFGLLYDSKRVQNRSRKK